MALRLPREILYMILGLLRDERDYASIYRCALSSKYLAGEALTILYQMHDTSPVTGGGGTEEEQVKARRTGAPVASVKRQQERMIWKWALMWRSILLSALDQTYLPYYSYIRHLNLDDLTELLSHSGFKGKIRQNFFTPELYKRTIGDNRLRSTDSVENADRILANVGSVIIKKTNTIRDLSCNLPPDSLSELLEKLPYLQTLSVWSGNALTKHVGDKIHKHCPNFKQVTVYRWSSYPEDSEIECETFLSELRPHSLEYFEVLSYSRLGPRSIGAMGLHLNSLTELKLTSLGMDSIAALPSLTAPPALRVLVLTDSCPEVLYEEHELTITRVAGWIRSCKSLQQLELRRFVDDPVLLSLVLVQDGPPLTALSVMGYDSDRARGFHDALASQKSLQNLYLSGSDIELPEENEILVTSITQLRNLRELELEGISDGFTPDLIMVLTPFLTHLEKLWISGDHFEDIILNAFLCLPKLQNLVIRALSEFTMQGILDFIAQLGPGNRGMKLSILNSTTEASLTEEQQKLIHNTLENSLGGSFDFGLAHEEYSDMGSEDFSD